MPMSGGHLSGQVQANMVSDPPNNPATAHVKAWDNVGAAIVGELTAATHTPVPVTCNNGGTTLVPVDPASISASGLKKAVLGSIAGVGGVTPSNAHQKYWDAISSSAWNPVTEIGGIIGYLTAKLKLKTDVSTTSPGPHTYTPTFGTKTGADLGAAIRTAIAGVSGVTPANAHDKYWDAATSAIVSFIVANYKSAASPGVGGSSTTLIVSVS